ncbi:MAG: DMT family transporter [Ignavibacteriales bacterium]|nr:DMT family transporter [Ignavibacteriales bacterium]
MVNQKRAYVLAIAAIFCWSTIATAFKLTLQYIDFIQALLVGCLVSTGLFFVIINFQKKTGDLKKANKNDLLKASILGFLNPFLYYLVLLKAYTLLKAQEAGTLNYIWPITLVLLSIPLLKQKIGWLSIMAIFISFFGIILISTEGHLAGLQFREPLGVTLAVGSSIFWALYWILNMKDKKDETLKLFLNFAFGSIYILIAFLIISIGKPFNFRGIIGAIYIGIFEMGITYFLWLKALKYSENTARISNLVYLSPFLSLIIISLVLGEKILLTTLFGLVFIVGGILLQYFAGRTKYPLNLPKTH